MIFIGSWTSYTLLGVDSWGAERVGAEPFLGYMFLVLGHLIPYLGLIPLGAEVHPEGHGSSGAMSSFPRPPRNPLHPRTREGLGAPPSRLKYHIMTMGEWVVLWPTTREGGAEPH